ncbi:aldolase/citrate lyase family protein [Eubacterium sp. MSJ-33]|uniref:aldolase/citrate lyase family protein n=1 Tax=Eubacterium sp. MSJ-33 TaxID=2841528 RepID=UPI001C7994EA|nr:aldolase/citrate lyase family protein [Eubacterium sp. MSJ-33]QWT54156.1 aldolase [Eubacterium sp. MSJ-33]
MPLTLMYITNKPSVALIAEKYGVQRIWIDLETKGKEKRQKGMNTVKSHHTIEDIQKIKPLLSKSELLVRINPWDEESVREIEKVIAAGADIIMLPMWKTLSEVEKFVRAVKGRCKTVLLLETKEAEACLEAVLQYGRFDEIHIGLNDLHLSYGYSFMFELLANGIVESICKKIEAFGIPYGFGGIARLGFGDLPAEKIIMEHYRLGSTRAILSRSFCNMELTTDLQEVEDIFRENMEKLREYEKEIIQTATKKDYESNRDEVQDCVANILNRRKGIA